MTHIPEPGDILNRLLDRIENGPEYAAKAIREQRRYEIAKACMAAQESLIVYSVKDAAARSVAAADALLAELEKKP